MVEDGFYYILLAFEATFIALLVYGVTVKVSQILKRKDWTQNPT